MAEIMNKALRRGVQIMLFTKYLKKYMPQEPNIPDLKFWTEFQMPPMPDLSALLEDIKKQVAVNPQDIYTEEYLKAADGYNKKMEEERAKRDKARKEAQDAIDNAKNTKDIIKQQMQIAEAMQKMDEADEEYKDAKENWWNAFELDTIQKYKKLTKEQRKAAKKAADDETKAKKMDARAAMNQLMQSAIMRQYKNYVQKELAIVQRKAEELIKFYEDMKTLFTETPKMIRSYFLDEDGEGKKMVDRECDKIDRCWENLCEACKELSVDITTMVGKIPNPDVIVVGTAAGVPNPGHKIMVFMENVKKIATDIKKVLMYIKEMKSIAENLGFSMETIEAFLGMIKIIEALTGDYKKQFRNSVKQMQKKTKWIVETIEPVEDKEEKEDDDDVVENDDKEPEYKTRKAGYKYADLDVDYENLTISVKGYKCYCTRASGWEDNYKKGNGWKKRHKKAFRNSTYRKGGGDHTDNKGKYYYYIPADEMDRMFMLGSSSLDDVIIDNNNYYRIDGYDVNGNPILVKMTNNEIYEFNKGGALYSSASYDYENNTTKLVLADGRIVTIDYLASEGDRIKLNDGTYVQVI